METKEKILLGFLILIVGIFIGRSITFSNDYNERVQAEISEQAERAISNVIENNIFFDKDTLIITRHDILP